MVLENLTRHIVAQKIKILNLLKRKKISSSLNAYLRISFAFQNFCLDQLTAHFSKQFISMQSALIVPSQLSTSAASKHNTQRLHSNNFLPTVLSRARQRTKQGMMRMIIDFKLIKLRLKLIRYSIFNLMITNH